MRYKGVAYPLRKNPSGFFHNTSDIEQIKASLLTIILTLPGERIFESDFGTPLHTLNFNQPKEGIEEQSRQMIAASIKRWEKRIQINEITTELTVNTGGQDLFIEVTFIDPVDLKTLHKLTVEIPVGGNNG
jgi:phage baseplate assembly protein W